MLSNDQVLIEKIRLLANGGVGKNNAMPWYVDMQAPGINARMSELHTALGVSQMKKLDSFIARRRAIATRYLHSLSTSTLQLPTIAGNVESAWHLFVVRAAKGRDALYRALAQVGIVVNVHYVPIHTHSWYQQRGFSPGDFPQAEQHFKEAVSLPLYPMLTPAQIDLTVSVLTGEVLDVA